MHPDLVQLHRLVDGEASLEAGADIAAHVASCAVCSAQVAELQSAGAALHDALRALDVPAPVVRLETLRARARQRGRTRRQWLVAATLFVGLTGVAAASQVVVRDWLGRMAERAGIIAAASSPPAVMRTPPPPAVTSPVAAARAAGIAVTPGASFRVDLANAPRSGALSITRGQRAVLAITAPEGAATFTSSSERVQVKNISEVADYQIEVPAVSQHLEIWIGSTRVFLQAGARIECACAETLPSAWTVQFGAQSRR